MHPSEGFILGLSTGAVCIAYCGPVLVPYLMGEGKSALKNTVIVALFLSGRLAAYLLVGILAGFLGEAFLQTSGFKNILMGIANMALSVMLLLYGFYRFKEVCLGKSQPMIEKMVGARWPYLVPLAGGAITGINICPPFLLAFTQAASLHQMADSVFYFFMFFIGTSLYFIPFPFIGFFKRQQVLRIIGKFAAIFAGLYYFYQGFFMLIK